MSMMTEEVRQRVIWVGEPLQLGLLRKVCPRWDFAGENEPALGRSGRTFEVERTVKSKAWTWVGTAKKTAWLEGRE